MKHYIVTLLLLLSFYSFGQKKNYNIGILLDQRTEKINPLIVQLQDQIKAVVGEDATITFPKENTLVNNLNFENAKGNYQKLLNNKTDIILAFGAVNNKVINDQSSYQKPTILFGATNSDFSKIDFSKKTSGIRNFTYLIESKSFKKDILDFKELTDFKKLGIAIESGVIDLLPIKETFDTIFKDIEAEFQLIPFKTPSDISTKLNGIDAIYLAGGFFLSEEEIRQLAEGFIANKLPSFTSLSVDAVENGIMATNQSDGNLDQFMRRISLSVESYVNGTPLSEMPVYIEYSPQLSINYNTAQLVNVPLKYSLVNKASFVGEVKNSISKKTYNILDVINKVLENNLSLQSEKKSVDLSTQNIKTAKSNYLPSLTASASGVYVDPDAAAASLGQNPEFSTSGNVTLQQLIFSEGANANISIQKKLQKAQQETLNAAYLDAVFNSNNAYFNILMLKANAQIRIRNLELTKQNLKIAKQNFEAGQSGKSDVLRFTSQMAQEKQAVIVAINQLEQGYIGLNQLLNQPLETDIEIEDVALDEGVFKAYNYNQLVELLDSPATREPFITFLIQEAKKNAPELKSLQYNLEAVERNLKLNSNGRFLPTVALQGQYNRIFNRSGAGSEVTPPFELLDSNYNIGASVSIPILNRNLTNINRQTNIIQQEQLNINKENIELAFDANVRTGVLNMINQVSNIELSKVSEETAKVALELTRTAYSSGAVSIIQLIDSQNNYLNAKLAKTNAVYNFLINALQVERFLGKYFLLNSKEDNAKFNQRFLEFLNQRN